jgi:organic hydroperoxide reductase OsmC/OhrA
MIETSPEPEEGARLHLELEDGYRFRVDLGEGLPPVHMDEPPPLGRGDGPNASRLLGAAVGNCLSASLLFCLRKARVEVTSLSTEVVVVPQRNQAGRLRIGRIEVVLRPRLADGSGEGRLQRCLGLFEEFCVVTASVRDSIDVRVTVEVGS